MFKPLATTPKSHTYSVHYAWIVLAVTFLCLFVASALRSVPGIIMMSLEQEFDWNRETISGAISLNLLLFGLAGPFLGRLMGNPSIVSPQKLGILSVKLKLSGTRHTFYLKLSCTTWALCIYPKSI